MASQSDLVYLDVRHRVLAGQLRSGMLVEPSSAISYYALGRAIIFNALEQLVADGYLEQDARRRLRGLNSDPERISDRFDVAVPLFATAVRKVSTRGGEAALFQFYANQPLPTFKIGDRCGNDDWLVGYIAALRAIIRAARIDNLEGVIERFIPPAVIRLAIISMDQASLQSLAASSQYLAQMVAAADGEAAARVVTMQLQQLQTAVLTRWSDLARYPAAAQLVFDEEPDVEPPTGLKYFGLGSREMQSLNDWIKKPSAMRAV